MRLLLSCFAILFPLFVLAQKKPAKASPGTIGHNEAVDAQVRQALAELNRCRREAGLDTVFLSPTLSSRCDKHARYLALNANKPEIAGLLAHDEVKTLRGYTADGATAGSNSCIFQGLGPLAAVVGFFNSFYHRIPLLEPNLKSIGLGYYQDSSNNLVTVLDGQSDVKGTSGPDVVYYPAINQLNVPTTFQDEIPSPITTKGPHGFALTVQFVRYQHIDSVHFRLSDRFHHDVPCSVSYPGRPATSELYQGNAICAIPSQPLAGNRVYHVYFSCRVNGKPYDKEYAFSTGTSLEEKPPQPDDSPLEAYYDDWARPIYKLCNTAAGATYMTETERKVIYVLNLARANPRLFAYSVLPEYAREEGRTDMVASTYYQSLVETMNYMDSLGTLYPDSLCYVSAQCLAILTGTLGYEGHNRVKPDCQRKLHFLGECCDYGSDDPLDIVIDLLIDENVPDLGHRLICLSKDYHNLGVSIQPHKNYKHTAVLDFH